MTGGYTTAERRIVDLGGGRRAFRKAATDEQTTGWLRAEIAAYERLGPRPWLAEVLDAGDGWLLLEDLSDAHWPPPWRPGDVERALAVLDEVHAVDPVGFPTFVDLDARLDWWAEVAADPGPFLGLGVCSPGWLDAALPVFLDADRPDRLVGDELCHNDFRSDNLCFAGARTVVIDWNWSAAGNAEVDVVSWVPSLVVEGATPPERLYASADPSLVAMLAGYWARHAPEPIPFAGSTLRDVQRRQLEVALPWAAERLGLSPPAPPAP